MSICTDLKNMPTLTLIVTAALFFAGTHLISAQTSLEQRSIPPAIIYGDGISSCPSEQQLANSH